MSEAFPPRVWDVPLLRGLDARAKRELEAAGRVRRARDGETVYAAGAPADSLLVVTSGACAILALRRGDRAPSVLRTVEVDGVFGDEAVAGGFATRAFEARAEGPLEVVELPASVLRRVQGRASASKTPGDEVIARLERAQRRAIARDVLASSEVGRALEARTLGELLDAVRHVHVARAEALYQEGDPAGEVYFVVEGLLSAQTSQDGVPRVEAYLSRGDVVGDEEAREGERRRLSIVASGPTWLLAVPVALYAQAARRLGPRASAARRVRAPEAAVAAHDPAGLARTTAHVFSDVYRLHVARSLLVIDQDACIRCGHCAWSCASAHDDGVSRLLRRGDILSAEALTRPRPSAALPPSASLPRSASPLLVPSSCQHCKNPACMPDCPTGAIGRDARGEVFIREELCTGCGACAKACPWENIQLAPRTVGARGQDAASELVAVKCDLCAGLGTGPACVAACPVSAIARVDPSSPARPRDGEAIVPKAKPAWPIVVGGVAAGVGAALLLARGSQAISGAAALALVLALVAHAGLKRAPALRGRAARLLLRPDLALARTLYVAHVALGAALVSVTLAHTRGNFGGGAAGLAVAFALVLATGALGALFGAALPARLSRLEQKSRLPEALGAHARELEQKTFDRLSGRSELVKTLFARRLTPYRTARLGALALALSGRSASGERRRVRAALDALLEGRGGDKLAGLDELVALVVERRALGAERLLLALLRGWLPVHLATCAVALVLLVLHVASALGGGR